MKRALVIIAVLVIISGLLTGCTVPKKLISILSTGAPAAVQTEQVK